MNLVHGHDPPQLRLDLSDHGGRAARHQRDARPVAGVIHLGHGQAVDVVAAPGKQPDHAGQDARFVLDQHGQGVAFLDLGIRIAQVIGRMAGRALLDVQSVHGSAFIFV